MLSDLSSRLKSQFCCRHLRLPTLCSPLLVSDVFGYSLLSQRETTDVQVSVSADQEFALMCLRLYRRMRTLAVLLEKLPPDAFVLLTAGVDFNASDFGFLVGAVGVSMNLGKAPASVGFSCAGLCKRRRSGRFRCGDHGVHSSLVAPILLVLEDAVLLCFS